MSEVSALSSMPEPEFVYSIRDEAVKLRPQPSRPHSSRRARSDGQPPANAQVCYKAVAASRAIESKAGVLRVAVCML